MTIIWKKEIATAYLVKQRVMEADVRGLWPHRAPSPRATDEEIYTVEAFLGHTLDPYYRDFLRHANGWQGLFQAIDFFGTDDFMDGHRSALAWRIIDALENFEALFGLRKDEIMPIAVSEVSGDVFVMGRPTSKCPGVVVWLADKEIDRFPNFGECFLAMIDYNRREVHQLQQL